MLKLSGRLMHKKSIGGGNGKDPLPIVSILDENDRFTRVLDLADFDNRFYEIQKYQFVDVPISIRLTEGKNGKTYLNWAVAGDPVVIPDQEGAAA